MSSRIILIAAITACVATYCSAEAADDGYFTRVRPVDEAEQNAALDALEQNAAPKLEGVRWLNGDALDWDALKGKVVLIDFWGVWCAPCRAAIPSLNKLYNAEKDNGLVVIGVHTVQSRQQGIRYVGKGNVEYPVVFDDSDKTAEAFHVREYPSYYLIDSNGVVRFASIYDYEIEEAVDYLLKEREESNREEVNDTEAEE